MKEKRKIDTRESLKVVTTNNFITAMGLENISLKARKLLYVAISQCKQNDTEFYEYMISAKEFAKMMNISASHVYEEADKMTDELMRGFIRVATKTENKKKGFKKYNLFSVCEYQDSVLKFKLNKDMTDFLLKVKGDFTQPLLDDFLRMNSRYSIEIWHLMQREMHSKKAFGANVIEFDLSLSEIRQATGTCDKFERLSDIKRYVLDKAIREIRDNCGEVITYEDNKSGRTVTSFHFRAVSQNYLEPSQITKETRDKLERFKGDVKHEM